MNVPFTTLRSNQTAARLLINAQWLQIILKSLWPGDRSHFALRIQRFPLRPARFGGALLETSDRPLTIEEKCLWLLP